MDKLLIVMSLSDKSIVGGAVGAIMVSIEGCKLSDLGFQTIELDYSKQYQRFQQTELGFQTKLT